MTVAAIVMIPNLETAFTDAHGEPAVRRVVQAAWAGGALPVIAVAAAGADSSALADALADLPATLLQPSKDVPHHGIGRFVAGFDAAVAEVSETAAALLWPLRYAWVDPETVTSLVEAHGATPESIVRPAFAGQAGFPVLVPVTSRETLLAEPTAPGGAAVDRAIAAGVPARTVELGDPGIVHDLSTPWSALPPFHGPEQPAGGPRDDETGDAGPAD